MRRLAPLLVSTWALASCALAACGSRDDPPAARPAAEVALVRCVDGGEDACSSRVSEVTARWLLRREPHLGVACPRANSIACDRVGLALWLGVRARRVTATVDGRALRLRPSGWSAKPAPWIGYLRPAGLLDGELKVTPDRGRDFWEGRHPKSARLVVRVTRMDGTRAVTRLDVALHAGWG
jgi:hypothetical protein